MIKEYPQEAIDHALNWADTQEDGPPGFWNDLRALAWAYRLATSEAERFERAFQEETQARSRAIEHLLYVKSENERLRIELDNYKSGGYPFTKQSARPQEGSKP